MSIGQRISELRRNHGYSQEYIAEKLNVSRQAVSKWEQDLSAPDTYNLIALAELLGVSVEYLATGKKQEPTQELPPNPSSVTDSAINTPKIAGLILLGAGLLALILGCILSRILLAISALLLLYGILCLTVRKHLGLVLLGVSLVISLLLVTMLMPIRVAGDSGNSVTVITLFPLTLRIVIAAAVIFILIKIIRKYKNKIR